MNKKLVLLALAFAAFAFASPVFAADTPVEATTAVAIAETGPASNDLPAMCVVDVADSAERDNLEVLLEVAPAGSESCYPPECPCPAGFRCWAKCCV